MPVQCVVSLGVPSMGEQWQECQGEAAAASPRGSSAHPAEDEAGLGLPSREGAVLE